MGIFDSIEKLINEHGSAVILRERVALAKDQYDALEKKNDSLIEENGTLRSHVDLLSTENAQLKDKVATLEKQLAKGAAGEMNDVEVKILTLLAKHRRLSCDQIASACGISAVRASHHLGKLDDGNFVSATLNMMTGATYVLDERGTQYLVEHDLVD